MAINRADSFQIDAQPCRKKLMHSSLLMVLQSERIRRQGPGIVRPAAFRFALLSVMITVSSCVKIGRAVYIAVGAGH